MVAVVHTVRAELMRQQADEVLASVQAFRLEHGRYPEVAELGLPTVAQGHRKIFYTKDRAGAPVLFYRGTQRPFESFLYDFHTSRWRQLID